MSRYAAAHAAATGPGDSRPTALQIVNDAGMAGKLNGKIAVVTGVSSGIGVETVRALAKTGLKFFLPGRNPDKVKQALGDAFDADKMELVFMDQTSLASVREAAKEILSKTDKISLLINNAGIMGVPELQLSKDGHELQFATNYLSHFLLFKLLEAALLAASTPEFNSRVVSVSSDSHRLSDVNESGNYSYEKGGYHPFMAYGQSKSAIGHMANEIDRRYGARGLHATAVHPGVIATLLGRFLDEQTIKAVMENPALKNMWKSPEQGAATTVWAAIGKEWEGRGGKFLSHFNESPLMEPGEEDETGTKAAPHIYGEEVEKRLWEDSLAMVNL